MQARHFKTDEEHDLADGLQTLTHETWQRGTRAVEENQRPQLNRCRQGEASADLRIFFPSKASAPAAPAGSLSQSCSYTLISPGTANPTRSLRPGAGSEGGPADHGDHRTGFRERQGECSRLAIPGSLVAGARPAARLPARVDQGRESSAAANPVGITDFWGCGRRRGTGSPEPRERLRIHQPMLLVAAGVTRRWWRGRRDPGAGYCEPRSRRSAEASGRRRVAGS